MTPQPLQPVTLAPGQPPNEQGEEVSFTEGWNPGAIQSELRIQELPLCGTVTDSKHWNALWSPTPPPADFQKKTAVFIARYHDSISCVYREFRIYSVLKTPRRILVKARMIRNENNAKGGPSTDFHGIWIDKCQLPVIFEINGKIEETREESTRDYELIRTISVPGTDPNGLAYDGTSFLYADSVRRKIDRIDARSGKVVGSFAVPGSLPAGLCWDGRFLWHSDTMSAMIYKLNPENCSVATSFKAPGHTPMGLAWHEGFLYHVDHDIQKVFKLDAANGKVLHSIPLPGGRHMGITWRGKELWVMDGLAKSLRQINLQGGSFLRQVPIASPYPANILSEGENFWYIDYSGRAIYGIRLSSARGD